MHPAVRSGEWTVDKEWKDDVRALGLTTPATTRVDERDELRQRLERIWRDLTPEQREILLTVGAQMKRKD